MGALSTTHVFSIVFWLGVVAVEFVIERAKIGKLQTARLHQLIDRYIEMPVAFLVLITGGVLWYRNGWSTELLPKVLSGTGVILCTAYCYYCVEKRAASDVGFSKWTRRISRATTLALFLLGLTIFFGAGGLKLVY